MERALSGRVEAHHRFMLATHLSHVDFLDEAIARLSAEIEARLRSVEAELDRLATIPGVGRRTAEVIAAEVGLDMGQFPSARHLAAWAGMAPGNHESGGRRLGGATRPGNKWLRRALVEAATAAARNKRSHLAARYRRLAVRCGRPKARVAVGHAILVTAYHLLDRGTVYQELDPAVLDERRRDRVRQRALHQLATLGYAVTLHERDGPAA